MSDDDTGREKHSQQEPGSDRPDLTELYERMSRTVRENLERAGQVSEEALERALQEARDVAAKLRENYGEDVARVAEYIRRDWNATLRRTREQARRSFDFDRLQTGVLSTLARLAKAAGEQLAQWAGRIDERLTYKTGEIAGAGTLQCQQCRQTLSFEKATRIPPCPKCRGTAFRRGF